MGQVLHTEQAAEDLIDVLASLMASSQATADRFDRTFEKKARLHARFPELGAPCEELSPGLRTFTVARYLVFYRPIAEGILIVRVLHGTRDLPRYFD